MNDLPANSNPTIAPLKNVALFMELMDQVMNRPGHLPGIGACTGFSGLGKTFSATYAANKFRAYYLEVGESWSQRFFCQSMLREIGADDRGTIADMVARIIQVLATDERPLIIDEFDVAVKKGYVELIREIHMKSDTPMIIIGEELLPSKLERWERFHNRVLVWMPAHRADLADARHLARMYCAGLDIKDDLLRLITEKSYGRTRRICVNLQRAVEEAKKQGRAVLGIDEWGDTPFFTGQAPTRRRN